MWVIGARTRVSIVRFVGGDQQSDVKHTLLLQYKPFEVKCLVLLIRPQYLSSLTVFSGVRAQSLGFCVVIVDHSLSFVLFYFSQCIVCPTLIIGF